MTGILQVVPPGPSDQGGVDSYASALAWAIQAASDQGLRCERVVTMAASPARGLPTIVGEHEPAKLLVHYANYGYATRGCPAWLVEGVRSWRAADPQHRLAVFFHEIRASGPPWRSSFWLSRRQLALARRLAAAADWVGTSLPIYNDLLAPARPRVHVLPVFSTVGESVDPAPPWDRQPTMIVFGSPGVRARAFGPGAAALARAVHRLGIERLVDVGARPDLAPPRFAGVPVDRRGPLAAEEVGNLVARARAGFLSYPAPFLGKSTIFAAYAAHGAIPVRTWSARDRPGEAPAWDPNGPERSDADLAAVAGAAHAWYRDHRLERQAQIFREALA